MLITFVDDKTWTQIAWNCFFFHHFINLYNQYRLIGNFYMNDAFFLAIFSLQYVMALTHAWLEDILLL